MVLTRISGQIPLAGAEPSPLSGGQPGARPRSADGGQSCGGGAAVTGEVADLVGARRGRGNRSPRSRPLGVGRCALLPGTGAGHCGPAPGRDHLRRRRRHGSSPSASTSPCSGADPAAPGSG